MKKLILFLVASVVLLAQNTEQVRFMVYKATTLSSTAEVVTIQQPSTNARRIFLEAASVYCSAACDVTLEINGTAATTTSQTIIATQVGYTSAATAFVSSNVGVGTVLNKISIPAGQTAPIGLIGIGLLGNNTGRNFTIRTNSISAEVRINITWIER